MVSVGINGFGRIGRLTLRALAERHPELEVRLVNDPADPRTLAALLRRDTSYGPFPGEVRAEEDCLIVNGRRIRVTHEPDPTDVPWGLVGAELVMEASGRFHQRRDLERHLRAGARRVLLATVPDEPLDATVVMGVNHERLPRGARLVSAASCATNCAVPMLKVLDDAFGLERAWITVVHALTADQPVTDAPRSDPRLSRSGPCNVIPTTTRVAHAIGEVLPETAGRVSAMELRVPVQVGSIVDLSARVARPVTREALNAAFATAAAERFRGVLRYTEEPLVSSDVIGDPHACVLDGSFTGVAGADTVKLLGWFDNEFGFSARSAELLRLLADFEEGA